MIANIILLTSLTSVIPLMHRVHTMRVMTGGGFDLPLID